LAPPEWTSGEALKELTYDYTFACIEPIDANRAFLFVVSSRRSDSYFRTTARALVGDRFRTPSMHVLSKLLHGMTHINCQNIGKRRHDARASGESYSPINGRSPQRTVTEADTARYGRGQVSVTGLRNGKPVSIGYSPGGRVWSPDTSNLVAFRRWCHSNAKLLTLPGDHETGTELDLLKSAEPLCAWKEPIVHMDWNQQTKLDRDKLWTDDSIHGSLYETEIRCVGEGPKNCRFEFEVSALGKVACYSFT
jgi:hypothetical protein